MSKTSSKPGLVLEVLRLCVWIIFVLPATLQAQKGLQAYDQGNLTEVRRLLHSQSLEAAEDAFLRAALTTSADSALEGYRSVLLKYPDHPVSQRARARISQYYYALGNYSQASEIAAIPAAPTASPPTPKVEPAMTATPKSSEDSASEDTRPKTSTEISQVQNSVLRLQVGAFSKKENAKALQLKLENAGYQVVIIDAKAMPNRLYTVQLSGFTTREAAQKAAEEINKNYGLRAILVTSNP